MLKKGILFVGCAIFFGYFLMFGVPLNFERFFVLEKTIVLSVAQSFKEPTQKNYIFYNDGLFGVLNNFFELTHLETTPSKTKLAYADKYYIFYQNDSAEKVVKNITGDVIATIKQQGTPIFFNKYLYIVDSQNGVLSQYSATGRLQWRFEVPSYITAVDFKENHVMVGLLNGGVIFVDANSGSFESEYRPSGSLVDVIYGVALSNSSRYAAVVSGLNPQRFVLLERGKNNYMPIFISEIKNEMRRTVYMNFSKDEKFVSFEEPVNFFTYDIKANNMINVPYQGVLKQGIGDVLPNYQAIVSKSADKVFVKIFSYKNNYIIFDEIFDSKEIFVAPFQDGLLLALDKTISRISLVRTLQTAKALEKQKKIEQKQKEKEAKEALKKQKKQKKQAKKEDKKNEK